MRGCASVVSSLLVLSLYFPEALAQKPGADNTLAKQYYKLSEELYNRSDYEGALRQFQQAYRASPRPAFLYNMARCHESLGRPREAVENYEKYLESRPANEPVIRARIANLKKRLPAEQPPATRPAITPPVSSPTVPVKQPRTTVTQPRTTVTPTRTPDPLPVRPPRSQWKRTFGWVLVGVGGAALITSVILGVKAKQVQGELEQASAQNPPELYSDWRDKEDQGSALAGAQILTLGVGAATAIAGGVLVFLDLREERQARRASISPTLTRGGAFVAGTWRF